MSLQKKHPFPYIYTVVVECCVIASLQVLVIVYSVCGVTLSSVQCYESLSTKAVSQQPASSYSNESIWV